ncbi:MAG: hypothetical protein LBD15_04320 [Holosporales bacterium]|jgi:type VI secretion system protein|nr:hypothetical protein [Holosporales bacterium]
MGSTAATRYLLCGLLAVLEGCSSDVPLETVSLSASSEANSSYATIVDLVVLFDKDLAAKISSMPASQYFTASDQLEHDNEELMLRWRWEVVPGQVISRCPIAFEKYRPLAAFVFARYYTPGDHRKKLTPVENIAILLEQEDFRVCELIQGKTGGESVKSSTQPLPRVSESVFYQNARAPKEDRMAKRRARRERLKRRLKARQNKAATEE